MTHHRTVARADVPAAVAAMLSFFVPGLGQAYNGQYSLAALFATPLALIVGLALLVVTHGTNALSRLLDARLLIALIVLDLAFLGWRLVAILQAHGYRSRLRVGRWTTWVTIVAAVLTVGMHAVPAYYAAKAVDTLGSVSLEGGGDLLDGGNADGGVAIVEPSDQPEVSAGERVTVLFVGIDFGPGRDQRLTDTMLVATLDPVSGEAAMISVPRDLYGVELPDGSTYDAKLNSLMSTAASDPGRYPLGGAGTLKSAIGDLLGTRIHYFAAIDLAGMREVIDTIGGVEITVARTVDDPTYYDVFTGRMGLYIPAGEQHMDGTTALAFVRSRMGAGETDFTRAERQQQVLTAIAEKLTAGNLLVTLPGLLDAVRDNVATDIPSARLPDLAAEAQAANLGGIERIVLTPPEYVTPEPFSDAGYILHPNADAIRALGERIFGSTAAVRP